MKKHTDLKVGMFWGDMGVDFWDATTWKQEVEKHEVRAFAFSIWTERCPVSSTNLLCSIMTPTCGNCAVIRSEKKNVKTRLIYPNTRIKIGIGIQCG